MVEKADGVEFTVKDGNVLLPICFFFIILPQNLSPVILKYPWFE